MTTVGKGKRAETVSNAITDPRGADCNADDSPLQRDRNYFDVHDLKRKVRLERTERIIEMLHVTFLEGRCVNRDLHETLVSVDIVSKVLSIRPAKIDRICIVCCIVVLGYSII